MLSDYSSSKVAGTPVTLEILQNDTIVKTVNTTLGPGGYYEFEHSIVGNVQIRAKASHWLAETQSILLPYTASVNFSLINGDINNDNRINVLDYIQLKANYNKTDVVDYPADLNGDGRINVLDYIILKRNYNKIGQ